jgi:hypothetical protein
LNIKKIFFSVLIVFFVVLAALRGALFFWIDKQEMPMPAMSPWKIAILKLSHDSYIQMANEKIQGNLTWMLAEFNWDFGYFAAIKKNNPAGSACINSMMDALRKEI